MTLRSLPFLFTSITYLFLGLWIIIRQKNKVQKLYGTLCLATCFWQGIWTALFSNVSPVAVFLWLKVGYTGIVLIPPIFYHFIIEFTRKEEKSRWLQGFYVTSLVFIVLIWFSDTFISGLNSYSW